MASGSFLCVPVRLVKRDQLFTLEKLVGNRDDNRVEMLARQHGIRQKRDDGGIGKTVSAFIRRADEGTLSRLLVESSILIAVSRCYRLQSGYRRHRRQGKSKEGNTARSESHKESSIALHFIEGRQFAPFISLPQKPAGRTRAGFSLHPHPAKSGRRSPAARQDDVPSLLRNSTGRRLRRIQPDRRS